MPRIVHIASKVDDLEEATNFTTMSSAFAFLREARHDSGARMRRMRA